MRETYANGFAIDEEIDNERRSTEGMEGKSDNDYVLATERLQGGSKQIDVETLTGDLEEVHDNGSPERAGSRCSARNRQYHKSNGVSPLASRD